VTGLDCSLMIVPDTRGGALVGEELFRILV
jgi:hypothetical protein